MQTRFLTAVIYSVLLHGLLVAMLVSSFAWRTNIDAATAPPLAIQATVVDETMISAELAKLEAADQRIKEAEDQRQKELIEQAARAKAEREKEEQRLANVEREREEAEKRAREQAQERDKAAAERKLREDRESAERLAKAETEKKRLAELEQTRIMEEQRLAAVAEQRAKEEAARREAAALEAEREKQRVAKLAEQQAKEAAARRRAAAEAELQAEREEQLQRAVAEETARREAEEAGLLDQYKTWISQSIVRNWNQPPGAVAGLKCELLLTQIPGGEVTDVEIISCNGDAVVVRSIEAAVFKASPLPSPKDPRLFDKKVRVLFEPKN